VLGGLVLAQFGFHKADAFAAIGVAVIIIFIAYRLGKKSVDVLLDRVPDGVTALVEQKLRENQEIKCFHDLKIRVAGADTFIRVNVHFNSRLNLVDTHRLCDEIEKSICESIPRCEIIIHPEPD
jgi:cation diffusion facilitator family transporter